MAIDRNSLNEGRLWTKDAGRGNMENTCRLLALPFPNERWYAVPQASEEMTLQLVLSYRASNPAVLDVVYGTALYGDAIFEDVCQGSNGTSSLMKHCEVHLQDLNGFQGTPVLFIGIILSGIGAVPLFPQVLRAGYLDPPWAGFGPGNSSDYYITRYTAQLDVFYFGLPRKVWLVIGYILFTLAIAYFFLARRADALIFMVSGYTHPVQFAATKLISDVIRDKKSMRRISYIYFSF